MSNFPGSSLLLDDYGSAGLHPFTPTKLSWIKGTVDGIYDEHSPFGNDRDPAVIPGFTACFSLRGGTDDEDDTFEATGFSDVPTIRSSLSALPVPHNKKHKHRLWAQKNIAFRGLTPPDTDLKIKDTDRKGSYIIDGATDLIVSKNVRAGDYLAIEVPSDEQRRARRDAGSMLEKRNPDMLSVISTTDAFFNSNFSGVVRAILETFPNPRDLKKLPTAAAVKQVCAYMENQPDVYGYFGGVGKKQQIKKGILYMKALNKLGKDDKKYKEDLKDHPNDPELLEKRRKSFIDTTEGLSKICFSFHSDIQRRTIGRALTPGKGGFTTYGRLI